MTISSFRCIVDGYHLPHYRVLSIEELEDMVLVECVRVPLINRFYMKVRKMALVKDEFLYPAFPSDPE